jgi:hypothetical protein
MQIASRGLESAHPIGMQATEYGWSPWQDGLVRGAEHTSREHQCMGHAEDQVIVAHRQLFLQALGEPLVTSVGLALGADGLPVAPTGAGPCYSRSPLRFS